MSVKSQTSDFFIKNWFAIGSLILAMVGGYFTFKDAIKDHERRITSLEESRKVDEARRFQRLQELADRSRGQRGGSR